MSLQNITPAERLIGKDRIITIAGLTALTLLSWVWVLAGAGTDMNNFSMVAFQFPPPVLDGMIMAWSPGYAALMLAMWWIMMIAMMIPSAAPMILLYGRVARHAQKKGQMEQGVLPTFVFCAGVSGRMVWFQRARNGGPVGPWARRARASDADVEHQHDAYGVPFAGRRVVSAHPAETRLP